MLYGAAFLAMGADSWDAARAAADQADDPVLRKVLRSLDLARDDSDAGFKDVAEFLIANPHWPRRGTLRLEAERRLPESMSAKIVVGWFDEFPPLTFDGILRYGDALTELDRAADLRRFAADRWTRVELSAAQQTEFLDRYGALLTDADHQARLEALLWANRARETRRLYPLLRAGQRALAEARLLLAGRSRRGVDRAVKAVPAELAEDEGLIYERVRWRRRADNTEGAIELLALEPAVPSRPDRWWTERNILARRLFADGDHLGAYELVHDRQGLSRSDLAEAEWLSGWLALRFIDRPDLAEGHFRRLYENVGTPISLARGAYWLGRTFETLGNRDEATLWFQAAARHDTAFYGQLAAGWLGLPSVARLPDDPPVSPEALSAFEVNDLVDIILALDQIGETVHADRFLRVLAGQSDDPAHLALTSGLALTLERRHIAVRSAKQASARGPLLIEAGYPILELSAAAPGPDTALLLALIRQESEFRVDAISRSGARGLMQLMPATARRMSRQLGVPHSIRRLTADPDHNIRLGSAYLARMLDRFDGSYILAVAAYNAGPTNVDKWLEQFGDPRRPGVGAIDWIESMPFHETRNYVQRVLENTQVYRLRRGEAPSIGTLERDIAR